MAGLRREHSPAPGQSSTPGRLNSWKAIAAYLDASVRSVQRWELAEGLPVHRHEHSNLGSVYAYASEIDMWFDRRRHTAAQRWRRALLISAGAGVIVLAAVALLAGSRRGWLLPSGSPHPIQSIAVLPFLELSAGPPEQHLGDTVTEELIAELSRVPSLRVISRTSMMRYKDTRKSVPEIARELRVDAVLEGSVLRSGGRIHINAQLIRAATDSHLWSKDFDSDWNDPLNSQHEIARIIAAAVKTSIRTL